jgi:ubiquitin carboxyl-terminal hydrolase 8
MTTLLQAASNSYNSAKNHLAFRGRRDEAYIEYVVANEIVRSLVTRNPEYPEMVTRNTRNNNTYQLLSKNLRTSQDQFQNIRQIIVQENQRNGSSPVPSVGNGSVSSGSRPPSQSSGVYPIADSVSPRPSMDSSFASTQPASNNTFSSPSKLKPPVRPKPESLHGNSVDPLTARFAALRNPTPANGVIRMPDAADFQPKRNSLPLKPVGPRDMPGNSSISSVPSIPPKIPLDTQLAANLPRVPDAVFSPARNMQTPSSVDPPRTSARSIIGTGGRSNSYAASVASSRPPGSDYEDGSYFPSLNGQNSGASRRRGIVGLPTETTITAERLFDSLKLYDILLIDVRSRQDFDEGHIDCASILCVEPLQLRPGMSAADIQNSLIISPTKEDQLFDERDKFNLIVYYDQSTKSNQFLQAPQTEAEENLRILHEALVDYNIDKPLQNSPMLLAGGLDAWVDLLGQPALVITRTYIGRPIRKPSRLPSTLIVGRKRVRQFNPLNAEEEREWAERARSESVNIPDVPEDGVLEEEDNELGFYRTREDFLRRYPDVQAEPESMVTAPTRQSSLPPYPTEPYPRPHSQPSPGYRDSSRDSSLSYSHPEMPVRPAPAAPRVSYSGAHDRNSVQPYNVVRSRYLPPPYMSHHDKPANVQLPRTGLVNFGATCYMNSIIQCLSATVPLSRCFRDGSYKKFVQRDNWKGSHGVLPDLYANLIHNLWLQNRDEECIRPITFRVSHLKSCIS